MTAGPEDIRRAADILVDGGVVAFPTETVYGLGALAHHVPAVERLFEMKGRPRTRPLIIHIEGAEALDAFALDIPDYARRLAERFWPGPLTLVLRRASVVPDIVTGGGDTVGLRAPDHPTALALIRAVSERTERQAGIAGPSANRFGEPPPTNARAVVAGLGHPGSSREAPDMVLDGGECKGGIPSTVLACEGRWPRILRRGSVTPEAIEKAIGRFVDN